MTILYLVYSFFLICGGIIGFARAKSLPSLITSVTASLLMTLASLRLHHHPRSSLGIAILVSLVIGVFFFGRYQATIKPMPALPVIAVSALVLLASVLKLAGAPI